MILLNNNTFNQKYIYSKNQLKVLYRQLEVLYRQLSTIHVIIISLSFPKLCTPHSARFRFRKASHATRDYRGARSARVSVQSEWPLSSRPDAASAPRGCQCDQLVGVRRTTGGGPAFRRILAGHLIPNCSQFGNLVESTQNDIICVQKNLIYYL